ncbi:Ran-binding protein 9 [Mortierella sp. AD032]|nr:Ran-binding protein 9 [Mortierella sp. AD032]
MAQRENSAGADRLSHEDHEADSDNDSSMVHNFIHAVRRPLSRPPTTTTAATSSSSSATTLTTGLSSAASTISMDSASSSTSGVTTGPIDSTTSDLEQTSLNVAPSVRHYPQLPLRTAQNRASQQLPHRQGAAIPLPEREDSSRTRVITFGTLKKASMPNRASASSPLSGDKQQSRLKTDKTELSEDDLQVRYTGPGKADSDASAIRANRPIPPQCGVYYYEVLIKSNGQQGYIGIGACNANVELNRLPGWEPLSWGYHGDDGNGFEGCGNGRPFGPVFTTGDVIGCGINFRDMTLFYTKNGIYLGVAFRNLKGQLYPTVGMRTSGEIVEANFGQRDFVFNIEEYVKDEKVEAWQSLEDSLQKDTASKNQVGVLSQNLSKLVLSYMIHHGYSESARQFASDLAPHNSNQKGHETQGSNEFDCASMVHDTERRKEIRRTILSGDIDHAMAMLEESYPGITTSNEDMLLQLRCRKFVEMVSSASSPLRALDSQARGKSTKASAFEDTMLIDAFSVLAYSDADSSSGSGNHFGSKGISREKVASTVNLAILASQHLPTIAPLETVFRQTNVALSELTRQGVGEAAFFDLNHDLE